MRAFLAREREVGGLWHGDGDGVVDESSLSESEAGSGCAGCRGTMSSPLASSVEGACMWARESSGSSLSCEGLVGAMSFTRWWLEMCSWLGGRGDLVIGGGRQIRFSDGNLLMGLIWFDSS